MEKNTPDSRQPSMNDYYKVVFTIVPADSDCADLLASDLADTGYESFVSDDANPGAYLTAYVPAPLFSEADTKAAAEGVPMECDITFTAEFVPGQDWNSEWEKHYFQPIVIGGRVAVHSSFHTDVPEADYDIVVDPRMAFGTGHHATTCLMMQYILDCDMSGKTVTDMGTGTGILAILAAMRGAKAVTAIEIDSYAAENAEQNICLNLADSADTITLINGDATALKNVEPSDFFLANINRNIITADIAAYAAAIKPGGQLAVSGFYVADRPIVEAAAAQAGLMAIGAEEKDNWSSMIFVKSL